MPQILTDEPRGGVSREIHYRLLGMFLIVGLIAFALGFTAGIAAAGRNAETILEATK